VRVDAAHGDAWVFFSSSCQRFMSQFNDFVGPIGEEKKAFKNLPHLVMSDRKILNKIISFALKWVVRIKADSSLLTTDRYYK